MVDAGGEAVVGGLVSVDVSLLAQPAATKARAVRTIQTLSGSEARGVVRTARNLPGAEVYGVHSMKHAVLRSPSGFTSQVSPLLRIGVLLALIALTLVFLPGTAEARSAANKGAYGCAPRSPGRDIIVRNKDELRRAVDSRQPGDDIQVATNRIMGPIQMLGGTSGSDRNWITIRAARGFKPRIKATGFAGVQIEVNYIQICDFEIFGVSRANNQTERTKVGVSVINAHHVRIANNEVRNFSSGGIAANHSNNIEIVGNDVHHNSFWSGEQGSGISVFQPDRSRGDRRGFYQIEIAGNRSHHNENRVTAPRTNPDPKKRIATDGNGIILDDFRHVFRDDGPGAYDGRTLVANNVVFENGGRGIHAAPNGGIKVHIINNTAYHNMKSLLSNFVPYDTWAHAEISVAGTFNEVSKNVKVVNNVAIINPKLASRGVMAFFRNNIGDETLEEHHNSFNGPAQRDFFQYPGIRWSEGPHTLGRGSTSSANVRFGNPSRGNFGLAAPTKRGSNFWTRRIDRQDIAGTRRPIGGYPERGAYEYQR